MQNDPILILSQAVLTDVARLRALLDLSAERKLIPIVAGPQDAQKWLAQSRVKLSAILIGEEHEAELGQWMEWVHSHHVGTPVVLIFSSSSQPNPSKVGRNLAHGLGIREMNTLLESIRRLCPHVALLQDSMGTVKPLVDEGFFAVEARHFIFPVVAVFDVYVRVRSQTYVKVLHLGDTFEASRLQRYLEKGLQHFYIREEALQSYLSLCRQHAKQARASQGISTPGFESSEKGEGNVTDRLARQLHLGDVVIQVLKSSGVDPQVIRAAKEFCEGIRLQVEKGKFAQKPGIAAFIHQVSAYEHGVAAALVVHLFFKGLHIESPHIQNSIGMAALLHDLGRDHSLPEAKDPEHPLRSASLMEKIGGIEPIAIRAVRQHHESRDGKGYPKRLSSGQIHLFGELLSVADEMVSRIASGSQDAISEVQSLASRKYSYQIVSAFLSLFKRADGSQKRLSQQAESAKRFMAWNR
jgi:hypothetical protein